MAMEKLFDLFDRNHEGKISSEEFSLAIRDTNPAATEEDIKSMMEELDTNGDGSIDMNEFASFFDQKKEWEGEEKDTDESLMEAFKTYDLDGDGFISVQELHTVMMRLQINCSVEDCAKMIEGVDSDGNGKVDFQEFKNMNPNNLPAVNLLSSSTTSYLPMLQSNDLTPSFPVIINNLNHCLLLHFQGIRPRIMALRETTQSRIEI